MIFLDFCAQRTPTNTRSVSNSYAQRTQIITRSVTNYLKENGHR